MHHYIHPPHQTPEAFQVGKVALDQFCSGFTYPAAVRPAADQRTHPPARLMEAMRKNTSYESGCAGDRYRW
jgi:hypothetical protein